ncbi:hypothetical protein SAMN04487913_1095 [Arthrobacter sp. ok362]|nr:hypothetical protein SAMN04487913_1095 [Arthrobacter sp. ok362]
MFLMSPRSLRLDVVAAYAASFRHNRRVRKRLMLVAIVDSSAGRSLVPNGALPNGAR